MKTTLVQTSYKTIKDEVETRDETAQCERWTGEEPEPETPAWNHGDGPPKWLNSGWVYDGVLYRCAFSEFADNPSIKIARILHQRYNKDFENWARKRIALLESKLKQE